MRRLLPGPPGGEVDPAEIYSAPRPGGQGGRPYVIASVVSSLDGSAVVDGRSGPLGGPGDKEVFHLVRGVADAVVVGAETIRVENYGPVRGGAVPVVVVSASLELPYDGRLFAAEVADGPGRTVVMTTARSDPERRARAEAGADVVVAGQDWVDVGLALDELAHRGHRVVACEGGPRLLAQFVAADAVDEWCLTLAPDLVAGAGPRLLDGPALSPTQRLALASVLEADGVLFLRYLRGG